MFEFNNEEYSLEQITEAAKQSNMAFEDYIKEYNITEKAGKITPPKEESQGVPVEVNATPEIQPTVTELPLEDISLDLVETAKTGTVEDTTIELEKNLMKEARKGLLDAVVDTDKENVLNNFKTKYFGKEVFEPTVETEKITGPMGYQFFEKSREKTNAEIKEILGEEKYNQFIYFENNNELNPDLFKNQYEYNQASLLYENSLQEEKSRSAERYLRNTPEKVAKSINIYKDYDYESLEDLNSRIKSLNIQQETIFDSFNEFNKKNPNIEQDIKNTNTQLDSLNLKINSAKTDAEYNALASEYNNIVKSKDFKKIAEASSYYNSLIKESKETSKKLEPLLENAIDVNII